MCDCIVALAPATSRGATLFWKNSDRPSQETQLLRWVPPRTETNTVCTHIAIHAHRNETIGVLASQPTWMWGVEMGVNEAKVAIGNERIFTTLDPRDFPKALTGMDLVRLGLERAETAEAAVELLIQLIERYGQGGTGLEVSNSPYWSSFLVADPNQAWVLETSGRLWATERVDERRAISNRTTIASFDADHRHPRQRTEHSVDPRWNASKSVLADTPLTTARLLEHAKSHEGVDGYSVCMHVDASNEPNPLHHQSTTASMIAELPANGDATVWFAPGSPCRSTFTEHSVAPLTE